MMNYKLLEKIVWDYLIYFLVRLNHKQKMK